MVYGAEAIHSRPCYVPFARLTAPTLSEAGISDLGNSGNGNGAGNDSDPDTSNDSGSSSSNSNSNGSGNDGSESGGGSESGEGSEPGGDSESGGDSENSNGSGSGGGSENDDGSESSSDSETGRGEEPGGADKETGSNTDESKNETKESTGEAGESKKADENGSHSGGIDGNRPAGPDVPEGTEAELETLPAEVLSKPKDEKEAREPEDFYDDLIGEPEEELVQFDDRYRTYQTGDGEYITVVDRYSGLYWDKSEEALKTNNTLTETDVEDKEISVATGFNARRMRSMVSAGTARWNESRPMTVLLPEEMSGRCGYTITKGGGSLEIIPEGGDYTLSCMGDNTIHYSGVYENVDVQYTILSGTVREDVILLEKQGKDSFSYKLKSGSLKFRKKDNPVITYHAAPAILCSI